MPNSVTHIGDWAFQNCSKLAYVQIDATTPPAIGGTNIFESTKIKSIHIPCGTIEAYEASDWNNLELAFIEIGSKYVFSVQSTDTTMGMVEILSNPTCSNPQAVIHAIPYEGYLFTQWSDGSTDNPRTIILTKDTALFAEFTLKPIIPEVDTIYYNATVCPGESYPWFEDLMFGESGTYMYSAKNENGYDTALYVLNLVVLPEPIVVEETINTCITNLPYVWHGMNINESGHYTTSKKYVSMNCDSIIFFLNLKVNDSEFTEETVLVCDSYEWNGKTYTESGEYTYTTTTANGCDSIVTLHLTINKSEIGATEYATICHGETYTWNGQTYLTEGEYSITLSNVLGCDSVATLQLTIMPEAVTTTETVVIGSNDLPYTWRGNTYSATGQYTVVEQYTAVACDSAIHVLELTVLTTGNFDEDSITICDTEAPYLWYGESYSATGKYTYTEKYAGTDIDSIQHILNLTVNPTVDTEETIIACDSYEWNGETYTKSGEYTYTTTAANGCDSIVTLHLTINKAQYAEESVTACDSYEWNGKTYTESGEYTYTTTAANGCDSIVTLHLTINQTQYAEETVTACDSYEWNGETYTESGDYTYTTTSEQGCDRVETLHLTINKSEVGATEYVTICYDETYTWNGQTYAVSGEYSVTLTNAAGCDSLAVLSLTVLPEAIVDEQNISISENELPYTWHNQEINGSGVYTYTIPYTQTECDSAIYILNVEVETDTLENKCGDDLYWIYDTGDLTITGTGDMYNYTPTSMPWQALSKGIRTIQLPDEMSSIGAFAFANCYYLPSINIPSSVVTINDGAFENCRLLSTIRFANNGQLTTIGSWAFYNCHELKDVVIPEGVTEIGLAAFYGCANLKELTLPASLASIKDNGFAGCVKLSQMNVNAIVPPQIDARTFEDVDRSIPVIVPDESVEQYKSAPVWKEFNVRSKIGTGVENITSTTNNVQKIIRDGQLYILRDGKIYDMMGQEIK